MYLIVQSGDPVEFLSQFKFKFTPKSAVYFKAEDKLKPARILDTHTTSDTCDEANIDGHLGLSHGSYVFL